MRFDEAQREMRQVYLGGSVGTFVSALVWAASAAAGMASGRNAAMLVLIVGGMFIFPLTLLFLRAAGRRTAVNRANPLPALAMQVAFTVPLAIPLILTAARATPDAFYAGFLIVVGAHYLPFITLYGQPLFALPAALLLAGGMLLPRLPGGTFERGGWLGAGLLLVSGVVLALAHTRQRR